MKKYGKNILICATAISIIYVMKYKYMRGENIWFDPIAAMSDISLKIRQAKIEELNEYNEEGITGLMYAAAIGDQNRARWLLERGVDVNLRSLNRQSRDSAPEKDSALHFAIRNSDDDDGYEIALMILRDKRTDVNIENHRGEKPIHEIVRVEDLDRRVELIKELLSHGANINAVNYEGNTFVHLSIEQNSRGWMQRMKKEFGWKHKGGLVDIAIKNNQNNTPYQMALERGFGDLAADIVVDE